MLHFWIHVAAASERASDAKGGEFQRFIAIKQQHLKKKGQELLRTTHVLALSRLNKFTNSTYQDLCQISQLKGPETLAHPCTSAMPSTFSDSEDPDMICHNKKPQTAPISRDDNHLQRLGQLKLIPFSYACS